VRAELDAGVPFGERAALQARISQVLARTRAICAAVGGGPDDLPGPSRNAYRFLAAIDVDALPEPPADRQRVQPMRFPGMVAETEWLRQAMADIAEAEAGLRPWVYDDEGAEGADGAEEPRDRAAIRRTLDESAAVIRRDLAAPDRGAESLLEPTRRATRWICWLAEEGRLDVQLATLTHVARLARALPPAERRDRRVRLGLYDTSALVRGRHGAPTGHGDAKRAGRAKRGTRDGSGGWSELVANQGFVDAPQEVLLSLLRVGLGAKGAPRSLLRDYARGDSYRAVQSELEAALPRVAWAGQALGAGGHFHDLDAAFGRVNASYFGGAMARPSLRWSRRPNQRRLGHYDFTRDEVVLSVRLDAPDVPRTVVDFVVYHELLHKRHGLRHSGNRRLAHTAAFRRDERRFADYAAVQAWMEGMGRRVD